MTMWRIARRDPMSRSFFFTETDPVCKVQRIASGLYDFDLGAPVDVCYCERSDDTFTAKLYDELPDSFHDNLNEATAELFGPGSRTVIHSDLD